MAARIVPRASINEILAFLKGRGVSLSDEAIEILKEKLEEDPIGKPALERSRMLVRNKLLKDILDRTFVKRSIQLQEIADKNPLLQLIDQKRKKLITDDERPERPMPDSLRRVFYDESRWQPFKIFFGIPNSGQILKVVEKDHPDLPYIGYLTNEENEIKLYTTRRKVTFTLQDEVRLYRLRDGTFQYEKDEIKDLESRYLEYILSFHK